MNATLEGIARRPRVRRDAQELIRLSGGDPERVMDISIRRLGVGGTGKSEEIQSAAWRAFHILLEKERRS